MSTPELLKDLLLTIQGIQLELKSSDQEKIKAAQEAYHELLDGFYQEYHDIMAPQQYKKAKQKPDYFIRLIEFAHEHEKLKNTDRKLNS